MRIIFQPNFTAYCTLIFFFHEEEQRNNKKFIRINDATGPVSAKSFVIISEIKRRSFMLVMFYKMTVILPDQVLILKLFYAVIIRKITGRIDYLVFQVISTMFAQTGPIAQSVGGY